MSATNCKIDQRDEYPQHPTTAPRRRRRQVHWDFRVAVIQIPHHADMDDDEHESVWLSRAEFRDIRERLRYGDGCLRGLEWRRCEDRREAMYNIVFAEQQRRWMEDDVEDLEADDEERSDDRIAKHAEWLAELVEHKTRRCVKEAIRTGRRDALEAMRIHKED
eukprot:CAMPEP_0198113850 /NCGR_PEP_ID=MMETSP1442-20131203/5414_1 /TAXON_ID= /ORGANISM="Craspedostauros australis, Strain CCMP3328" /LENGTH=162 /DNA_ID=CAMNT_0043771043 /DNA_START=224 /DNA_END=712 /DNA_ORIENTATION=-